MDVILFVILWPVFGLIGSLILTWYVFDHDVNEDNILPIITGITFGWCTFVTAIIVLFFSLMEKFMKGKTFSRPFKKDV